MNRRLTIVQPYVPRYRQQFFEQLISRLKLDSIDCSIAAGHAKGRQALRADEADPAWVVPVRSRELAIGTRSLDLGGTRSAWKDADAVILGHEGSSLDVYRALVGSRRRNQRVGLWGHIRSYIAPPNALDVALERWQLRHADHIFAYTPGGAHFAIGAGVSPAKVTTVLNTVSTESLRAAANTISSGAIHRYMAEHTLAPGRVFAFVGGLDAPKRIAFLAEVLDHLWSIDAAVRVLVRGDGEHKHLLHTAVRRGQVILIDRLDPEDFAMISKVAGALLMPGRIGLVAVEALALEMPIITTNWPFHAPEEEYLVEDVSKFTAPNDPELFARYLTSSWPTRVKTAGSIWPYPSLETMVENFAEGVGALLSSETSRK